MSENVCGNCELCKLGSISMKDVLSYGASAVQTFGEEKGEEVLKYIQSIRDAGGGKRRCSASRPFAYKNDPCDVPLEFIPKN